MAEGALSWGNYLPKKALTVGLHRPSARQPGAPRLGVNVCRINPARGMGLTSGEADDKLPVGAAGRCWSPREAPTPGQALLCFSPSLLPKKIDTLI